MKSYDEITSNVLEIANKRIQKRKRIRYVAATSAVCLMTIMGLSVYMRLERPEVKPVQTTTETVTETISSAISMPATESVSTEAAITTDVIVTPNQTIPLIEETPPATSGGEDLMTSPMPADITQKALLRCPRGKELPRKQAIIL